MTHYDNALDMMEKLGGSFVQSLANCYYRADASNKMKLKEAFKDYFDRYEQQYEAWKKCRRLEGISL